MNISKLFYRYENPTKWKMLTTWWSRARSPQNPQTSWSLRIGNVNPHDSTLLPHHQLVRDLCVRWSQTLWSASLTWPLKTLYQNPSGSSGFWDPGPPCCLHGPAINPSLLQTQKQNKHPPYPPKPGTYTVFHITGGMGLWARPSLGT